MKSSLTTINKGAGWEATQHFQGSSYLLLLLFLIISFFLHALGTMHELSVGGCILHLIPAVFILEKKRVENQKKKTKKFFSYK